MMWQILSLFDFWFWAITTVFGIFEFIYVAKKKPWSTLTTLVIFIAVITLFSDFNIFTVLCANWVIAVQLLLIYILIGICWAVARWYFYMKKRFRIYDKIRTRFYSERGIDNNARIADFDSSSRHELLNQINNAFASEFSEHRYSLVIKPKAKYNINLISVWIAWWGFDIIIWACRDFLRDIFKSIALLTQTIFQTISDKIFQKYENDFDEDGSL